MSKVQKKEPEKSLEPIKNFKLNFVQRTKI
nr:hypothetical protein pmam_471 [Pithovirus mammoth]